MKRVLSLVLALVMVLGTIMPAFAEDAVTASQAGQDLESYGVIAGTENGLDEAAVLTRAMMATILADLYGMKAEAAIYELPSSFTDLTEGAWYVPYVAFAEAKGWMTGDAEMKTFRPTDPMSAQEVNASFVKALGYAPAWAEVNAKAVELEVAVVAANNASVLRGEAFAALRAALDVPKMGMTDTLGTELALVNYVPEVVAPTTLEVVSVTAINLVQTQVVFNQEVDVDIAEDEGNYTLTDSDDDEMTISSADLAEDGMTIVLTHENMGQQGEAYVEVADVEDLDENVIADYTGELIEYLDTTIPNAIALEVVGNDTIKVTFSESMDADTLVKANFEVDGGDLYIADVTPMNNNTEANIELYSDLDDGDVTVKVYADVEDAASFGVVQVTLTATVAEDSDGPVVIGFSDATTTSVTLIFNEEIEIDDYDTDNYYHTNSNNTIDAVVDADLSDDGMELTLDFTANPLPEGTAYIYILDDSINDLWDNLNEQLMVEIEVELDETAPIAEDIDVETETQIIVNFDEDLDDDSAEDEDNYTLLDSDGDESDIEFDDITLDGDEVTIDFDEELSGVYSLVIENVEDAAENEIDKTTIEFEVDDLTAPDSDDFTATIYNAGAEDQFIIVDFDQEMLAEGTYSIDDEDKYQIGNYQLSDLVDDYDAELSVVENGTAVKIEIPYDENSDLEEGVDFSAGVVVTVARVADAADNYMEDFSVAITTDASGNVELDEVEAVAIDAVEITFDDLLDDFEEDDLILTTNNSNLSDATDNKLTIASRDIDTDDDGNTVVTLELAEVSELDYDGKLGGLTIYAYIISEESVNDLDETVLLDDNMASDDVIAPELLDADADDDYYDDVNVATGTNNEFMLTFTEDLSLNGYDEEAVATDFVVKAGADTLTPVVDYTIALNGNDEVVFTLVDDYAGYDGDVEVTMASTTNYITDVEGNDIDSDLETGEFDVTFAPTYVTSDVSDATTLVITFSEDIATLGTFVSADVAAQFLITDDDDTALAAIGAAIDDDELTLTFTAGTFTTGSAVSAVAYTAAGDAAIVDEADTPLPVVNVTIGDTTNDL